MAEMEPKEQEICERTRAFALRIIKLHQAIAAAETGRILGRQLLKSGTSIGANVEEAQAGQSKPDFIAKMSVALKEARETLYWIKLLGDAELVPAKRLEPLLTETEELIKILYTIIQNTKKNLQRKD